MVNLVRAEEQERADRSTTYLPIVKKACLTLKIVPWQLRKP